MRIDAGGRRNCNQLSVARRAVTKGASLYFIAICFASFTGHRRAATETRTVIKLI